MSEDNALEVDATTIAYATFTRRIRAVLVDAAVVFAGLVVLVIADSALDAMPGAGRVELIVLIALLVLYEPILVWRRGATIGHAAARLRVVAEATGRHPTFAQAFARYLLKCVLGLPSFVTMALTRRHQAVHDVLTRTTVRVPELVGMEATDFHLERAADPPGQLPSVGRRLLVVTLYLVAAYALLVVAFDALLSTECLLSRQCTAAERLVAQLMSAVWIAASLAIIVMGWRGHLLGGRRLRRSDADTPAV